MPATTEFTQMQRDHLIKAQLAVSAFDATVFPIPV